MSKPELPECGIYFGLPETEYHAAPALSASGIKRLCVSPMDFWCRSWLAPTPAGDDDDTEAKALGRAYDRRITEGREAFYRTYAQALDIADHPGALRTADEIKAALREAGQKLTGAKAELVERLLSVHPDAEMWDDLVAEHAAAHAGMTLLSAGLIGRIEFAAAMIESHPDLKKCFSGGHPQVSIFWEADDDGTPMKARLDYLKTRAFVDLKTFSNPLGKPFDRAATTAMASYKYHVQAAVYWEGIDHARRLLRAYGPEVAHGDVDHEWLEAFADADAMSAFFVFQQTGLAPVARGYEFPRGLVADCGRVVVTEARRKFNACMEHYAPGEPWIDPQPIRAFADEEFPVWMTTE